jgi:hypothetical protein
MVLMGGAVAFAGAAALLVSTASVEGGRPPDHPPLTVIGGTPLRVIAIDGFDPAMFDAFAQDLEARFVGVRVRLQPQDTSDPARAWTTIATGVLPDVHGVHGIETRRVAGVQGSLSATGGAVAQAIRAATDLVRLTRPSVASREERRAKTLWEVAEEAGLRTAVVNWWATWPAPKNGIVITDRAMLRLEQGGRLDAEIGPPELYEPLRAAWPGIRDRARAAVSTVGPVNDPAIAAVLRRSAELDATIAGLLQALPGPARDLDVVYFPGLDIAQHALFATGAAASTPSDAAARVDALRGYYAFLRSLLGSVLEPSPAARVVIVTQPGRVQPAGSGLIVSFQTLNVDATAGLRGGGQARVEDIAPTLLNALGVPLSRELTGMPRPMMLSGSSGRFVETYGRPFLAPGARVGKPLDQEMIDRLRSLGYVR